MHGVQLLYDSASYNTQNRRELYSLRGVPMGMAVCVIASRYLSRPFHYKQFASLNLVPRTTNNARRTANIMFFFLC